MATTQTQAGRELLGLFPPGTTRDRNGGLVIGGVPAAELAESHGTPALILDEASVRARARRYADGLAARWPNSRTVFASKAFPCTAVIRLLTEEGLGIDVAGGGELTLALAAGADRRLVENQRGSAVALGQFGHRYAADHQSAVLVPGGPGWEQPQQFPACLRLRRCHPRSSCHWSVPLSCHAPATVTPDHR